MGSISSILAIGVIISAVQQRSNFYAVCIYLSKSSACMMILLNMGFIISLLIGKVLQTIFFGQLRAIEVEHLYEKSWYAVTETCLAMTIFREEFDLHFIIVFTTLLFLKIFHWLCQDRVEYMEQSPTYSITFHVRIVSLLVILSLVDSFLANHAVNITLAEGPNMMIMFGFEYTILICAVASIIGKYLLNVIDLRNEHTWEGKSMYVFYIDLVTEFFKLVTYIVFFVYICLNYQLPLHIIRDVYVTFRSFVQKCKDLYRYRRATRNMNELYPNATTEDLTRSSDITCIICREEMQVVDVNGENQESPAHRVENGQNLDQPKKLPCGHIFHFHCLRSWLERQQTCPTCRRSVLVENNTNTSDQNQQQQQQQQQPMQQPQQQQQQQSPMQPTQPSNEPLSHALGDNSEGGHSSFTNIYSPTAQRNPTDPSYNILTPNILAPNHIHLPGMIPLVPLNNWSNILDSRNLQNDQPSTLPDHPSDEELRILSTTTREAMEQRLQILESVQNQLFQSMQLLTQALSVIPSANDVAPTNSTNTPDTPSEPTIAESSSVNNKTTIEEVDDKVDNMSSRRREKMPERSIPSKNDTNDHSYFSE